MAEATIRCPKCNADIPLTETLAGPLVASALRKAQQEADARLAEAVAKAKADAGKALEEAREKAKAEAEEGVATRLKFLEETNATQKKKLQEATSKEIDILKRQAELEQKETEIGLELQRQLAAERERIRKEAADAAVEESKRRENQQTEIIEGLKRTIDDLKRKAEQGSQQTQGEAQEVRLEDELRLAFPTDVIEPVAKGKRGADCIQHVRGPAGTTAGSIIWESKDAQAWAKAWVQKLKDDKRAAGAEEAVLVSTVLPKEVQRFGEHEGLWVTDVASAIPLAIALRQKLLAVAFARRAAEGQQTKIEQVYDYLSGSAFRRRVEAVVDAYNGMKKDLDEERRAFTVRWNKRETQLQRLVEGMGGLYGDLQGIMGQTLAEVATLEVKALSAGDEPPAAG